MLKALCSAAAHRSICRLGFPSACLSANSRALLSSSSLQQEFGLKRGGAGQKKGSRGASGFATAAYRGGGEQFYATCHPGLEDVVSQELRSQQIGAYDIRPHSAGVSFRGADLATGYKANLWLRAAIRVLWLLADSPLDPDTPAGDTIYDFIREAASWPRLLPEGGTFSVQSRLRDCSNVTSTQLVNSRVRDAICDSVRDAGCPRPSPPDGSRADLPLFVVLYRDHISLYRDMSGESLHRRGYRTAMHRASLNESAAAGLLLLARWNVLAAADDRTVLADPMCGSGTFLIEAALLACNRAPGLSRTHWPFQLWGDCFEERVWRECVEEAADSEKRWRGAILGADIHPGAISLAHRDVEAAGVQHIVELECNRCSDWRPRLRPSTVVVNPPWGRRIGGPEETLAADGEDEEGLEGVYRELGFFLKDQCPEAKAFVLSGNKSATAALRMKADCKFPVTLSDVDARWIQYTVLKKKAVVGTGAAVGLSPPGGRESPLRRRESPLRQKESPSRQMNSAPGERLPASKRRESSPGLKEPSSEPNRSPSRMQESRPWREEAPQRSRESPTRRDETPSGPKRSPLGLQGSRSGREYDFRRPGESPTMRDEVPSGRKQFPSGLRESRPWREEDPRGPKESPMRRDERPSRRQQPPEGFREFPGRRAGRTPARSEEPTAREWSPKRKQRMP